MVCVCFHWFRFTFTQGGKPIGTANCLSPRSYKKVRVGRAVFPARRWSCLLCCALKPVTTWLSSSTAAQILPGSSSTAWLTVTVGVMAFWCYVCYDSKLIPLGFYLGYIRLNCICYTGKGFSQTLVTLKVLLDLRNPMKNRLDSLITTQQNIHASELLFKYLNQSTSLWYLIYFFS